MIKERGEIGAGAECAYAEIGAAGGILALLRISVNQIARLPALPDCSLGLRILNRARHLVNKRFERVRSLNGQIAAIVGVAVDINGRVLAKLFGMLLRPLR